MSIIENQAAAIERLKAELDTVKRERDNLLKTNKSLHSWREQKLQKKVDSMRGVVSALQYAAEVFEVYALHHFLKDADEKAQANRSHAKKCREALKGISDEVKSDDV